MSSRYVSVRPYLAAHNDHELLVARCRVEIHISPISELSIIAGERAKVRGGGTRKVNPPMMKKKISAIRRQLQMTAMSAAIAKRYAVERNNTLPN